MITIANASTNVVNLSPVGSSEVYLLQVGQTLAVPSGEWTFQHPGYSNGVEVTSGQVATVTIGADSHLADVSISEAVAFSKGFFWMAGICMLVLLYRMFAVVTKGEA